MMKKAIRICSIVLVLALFINMLPMQALGQMYLSSTDTEIQTEKTNELLETKDVEIIDEVVENRTEFSKEHVLSNGLHQLTLYPTAIHYETDSGWEEIDNTLKANTNGTYTNTAGVWNVSLPQQLSTTKPVTITKDGYTLSFAMAGQLRVNGLQAAVRALTGEAESLSVSSAGVAAAKIQKVDNSALKEAMEHPEALPDKLASRLAYESVYANTDVLYDLDSNKLKESIVLRAYDGALRGYRYTLNVGTMIPVLEDDGQITFYTPDKKAVVMVMPAPFLVDDAKVYNYDVEVQLTGSGSSYTLTYMLPQEWLADSQRQWPVVLDPVVDADFSASNINDQTVAETYTYSYTWGMGEVGYDDGYGAERFYIKYENLPPLSSADVVVGATMQLCMDGHGENTPMQVHKVNGTWTSQTITWANQPGFHENVEDYAILDEPGYYAFVVTDIVRDWYAGENTGMVFRFSDAIEAGPTDNWIQFYSSDYGLNKPILSVVFRNAAGLESYWDYTEASAGRAGTGYVNNFTGNLVWTKTHLGIGGNRMPVSISHVYNANNSAENLFGLGNGWRTNYHQRVYQWDKDTSYYVWEDADGTKHYFHYDTDTNKYKDEDGLELTLTRTNTQTKACYIEDKNGNRSYFDDYGRLWKLENNQQTKSSNVITYTTTTGPQIYQIKDGVNRTYTFVYPNGQLERINYTGTGTTVLYSVSFGYDANNNLIRLTDIDGENNTYTYTTKKLLSSATDPNGYKISYGYNIVATGKPSRVASIAETSNGTAGGSLAITYGHNQTKFVDSENNTEIYQFNDFGNTISVQDGEGHAQHAKYAFHTDKQKKDNTDPTKKTNQLSVSSKMQNTVGNRLRESSFETGNFWTSWPAGTSCETVSTVAYLGSKSLHLDAEERTFLFSESFTIGPGQTYTFSAYVKGVSGKTYLRIGDYASVAASEGSTGWVRYEVSYTNTTSADITTKAQFVGEAGSEAYIDCVQVEQAGAASRFNLLDNGDFIYEGAPAYSWGSSTINTATDKLESVQAAAAPQLINGCVKIVGQPTVIKRVGQFFTHSGNAGDCYVFSGWAKGNSVPLQSHDSRERKFELRIKFSYTDGTEKITAQPFNPDTDEWQYASVAAVAEKAYSSILVTFVCDYNMNTFYFDGMQLYKEEYGSSYTYDNDGNVVSVTDLQGQTTTYEYENNNLTKEVLSTGGELQYTYDNYHNVKTATTREGMEYHFTYDQWGNNTEVIVLGETERITATATYSADGNRLESTTDALGEETKFCYNVNTNVLEWVQYPKDTDGTNGTEDTRTKYTYDSLLRVASVAADTNTGLELSASYTYADDNLSAIQTPSTAYAFTYGNFGLRSSVSAGSHELAEYTYTAKTHLLSELLYGNGDKATYTYDDKGRLTKLTYEEGDTVSYHYDNDGALAKVVDSATGITTTYHYDLIGRMMKYVESGTDYSHTVGYTYDTKNNLTAQTETIDGETRTTGYTYDTDNRVTAVTNGAAEETYYYEGLGRLDMLQTYHNGDQIKFETFFYHGSKGKASAQVYLHSVCANHYSLGHYYFYDDNGNITSISTDKGEIGYTYNSANQLVRENNQVAGCTYTWEYDSAGNILNRKKYAYTFRELGTPIETVVYSYGDSSWGDLLTSYNGNTITYDAIGNPLSDGTWTYTWEHGRELASMTDGETTWDFTYNADGMRTKRTNGTDTYTYVYNGGQLSQMTKGTDTLRFTYGATGSPMALTYNGTYYYYVTNVQGDVIAILNNAGTAVVEYAYDAWGNPISATGTMAQTLGKLNPLRYRGYVYDEETGLYYVSSRYYDPEIGRWINADAAIGQIGNVQGANMFAYCFNNPVNMSDPTGNWPKLSTFWFGVAVAAAVVTAAAVTVVSCGAAAPVVAALTGTLVSAASATAAVTSVAYTACSVAIAATAVSAAALAQEEIAKKTNTQSHSVYVLKDSNDQVQYVGRTVNIKNRAAAHSLNPDRADLEMEVVATGLTRSEARALEQAGMLYHHTINTANKTYNQINGVAPRYWDAMKTIARGTRDYAWNQMTNEILYWAGF